MTKEEFIGKMFELTKDNKYVYQKICDSFDTCDDCPLCNCDDCEGEIIDELYAMIIDLQNKKAETNLEHSKPKYKLSQFECDLLDSCYDHTRFIKDSWALDEMHDRGYFKGVPTDVLIKDILDNCEVIDK